jgi:hypothetical protein
MGESQGEKLLPVLFAITLFLSAALLFLIQPLFAKMVLPLLGGTPAVWNTCMVFFQAVLLAGYAYAHATSAWLGVRRQAVLHLGLLLLPFLVLPLGVAKGWDPTGSGSPIFWLLGLLAVSMGLPFFMVSTNAPVLQRWFAASGHPTSQDPYFLYSASNLGSMVALVSYPLLLEPTSSLASHGILWTVGYTLLTALVFVCAASLWRARRTKASEKGVGPPTNSTRIALGTRLRWIALSLVPSSQMLSVTTYLTTDIAAIPLLWIIPLAIYLLSFILVFARRPPVPHAAMLRTFPLIILLLTLAMLSEATKPVGILILIHLAGLFFTAMVCHGELARQRPPVDRLTEFYLWMAVGGVLGGLFNALAAPLLFSTVVEYPFVLVAACLLRPRLVYVTPSRTNFQLSTFSSQLSISRWDMILPAVLYLLTSALVLGSQALYLPAGPPSVAIMFAVPAVICYTFLHGPVRFGLGIGGLFLAGLAYHGVHGTTLHQERSFFGIHRITLDPMGRYHLLVHGNTVHGRQCIDEGRRDEPLEYYHRTGPIGQLFEAFSGATAKKQVAIVGLGAGTLAAYGESGQNFTYYEIDPTVERIARDPRYFTFIHDSRAHVDVVLGDARLTLRRAPPQAYGLIVLDAFSSDAIPLHLVTREALKLYLDKLEDAGIIAFHISNRYVVLEPVLGALARDQNLVCLAQNDLDVSEQAAQSGKAPSQWVVMARRRLELGRLASDPRWHEAKHSRKVAVWTDDYSNLIEVFKWE